MQDARTGLSRRRREAGWARWRGEREVEMEKPSETKRVAVPVQCRRDDRAGQAGRQATLLQGSDKVGGGAPSRENREAAQYPVLPCTSLTWKDQRTDPHVSILGRDEEGERISATREQRYINGTYQMEVAKASKVVGLVVRRMQWKRVSQVIIQQSPLVRVPGGGGCDRYNRSYPPTYKYIG
ncbi:hypothetical protein B0T13DRAFT_449732 [Neurospora crassa]|nr:hypothetical protein B0T13DRAFT_449732 [Neurospora crassa]